MSELIGRAIGVVVLIALHLLAGYIIVATVAWSLDPSAWTRPDRVMVFAFAFMIFVGRFLYEKARG